MGILKRMLLCGAGGLAGLAALIYADGAFKDATPRKPDNHVTERAAAQNSNHNLEGKVFAAMHRGEAPGTAKAEVEVPVIKGYEAPVFQQYDKFILEAREFWNNFFKDEAGYKEPPLDLVKKMMLVETCWGGKPTADYFTDPMQVGKDFAYKVIAHEGGEGLFPKGGVPELKGKPLDARMSVMCGYGWIAHCAANYGVRRVKLSDKIMEYSVKKEDTIFDIVKEFNKNGFYTTVDAVLEANKVDPKKLKIGTVLVIPNEKTVRYITLMDFSKAAEAYNGCGDANYKSKVNSLEAVKK